VKIGVGSRRAKTSKGKFSKICPSTCFLVIRAKSLCTRAKVKKNVVKGQKLKFRQRAKKSQDRQRAKNKISSKGKKKSRPSKGKKLNFVKGPQKVKTVKGQKFFFLEIIIFEQKKLF
jgi:hypothetical protein